MKFTIAILVLACSLIGGWIVGNWRYDPGFNCICWCRKPGICSTDHCFCRGEAKVTEWIDWIAETPTPTDIVEPSQTPYVPPFPTWQPSPTELYPYPPIETEMPYP